MTTKFKVEGYCEILFNCTVVLSWDFDIEIQIQLCETVYPITVKTAIEHKVEHIQLHRFLNANPRDLEDRERKIQAELKSQLGYTILSNIRSCEPA